MAYLRHDGEYGVKDISDDRPDPEVYELGLNSRSFGEDHLITPQAQKLPKWVQYIWDNIAITPYGRLRSGLADIKNFRPSPYLVGNEKEEVAALTINSRSVIAQSIYINKTLDRDDVVDLADFDVISYLKKAMARETMIFIAEAILGMPPSVGEGISEEAIIPVTDFHIPTLVDIENGDYFATGEDTLFITPSLFRGIVMDMENMPSILTREQFADLYGFKDVVFVPYLDNTPVICDISQYYVGLPKGRDGEIYQHFNLDKNAKEVLYEFKACGLYTGYHHINENT